MTSDDIWKVVQPLMDRLRRTVYTPEYQDKAQEWELWGHMTSKAFKWAGCPIMGAAAIALEDSNFHSESKLLFDEIERGGCQDELR